MKTQNDEQTRDDTLVRLKDVMDVIKGNFTDIHNQLKNRSAEHQTIIGDFITVLESNLKKEIKQIKN